MSAVVTDQLLNINKAELPRGWRMATIGELLKVRNGFAFKSADYQDDGAFLIRQSNLDGARVTLNKARFVPSSYLEAHKEFLVKKGDILIGMSGSIGKLCTYDRDEPALQNQRTGLLVFKDPEQKRWVWHYLPLLEKELLKVGKGVAVQNVSASQIESFPIPVAPPDQQKRIVADIEKQFSRLDEAVANLKRVKANLKRYKAAVLKAAVEGRLVETEAERARREGRSYVTGAQLQQRILETRRSQWKGKGKYKEPAAPDTTDLPELPEGWVWTNFESAADRVTVGHVGSMKDEYVEEGVPFLRSQNVRANRYDPEGLKFISEKFHRQLGKSSLKPGDIVVVRSGSVGVTCVIPDHLPVANCSDLVIIKAPRAVLPDFGAYYMNSVVETRVAAGKVGIALTHFNTQSVAELPLPVPPMAEQHRIVAEVERSLSLIRETASLVDANLKRAERLRQSILQRAFSSGGDISRMRASWERTK